MMFNNWVRGIFGQKTRTITTPARRSPALRFERLDERITPDNAPVLTGSVPSRSYTFGGAAIAVDPNLTISDSGNLGLTSATVQIAPAGLTSGDQLLFTSPSGIAGSYSSATGTLTLTGSSSAANYQTVLRSVQLQVSAAGTGSRSVTFSITPPNFYTATGNVNDGHLYEFLSTPSNPNWDQARVAAAARNRYGRQGYLATLTSAGEQTFAATIAGGISAWIGGSDAASEGAWRWVTGPEGLQPGGGLQFWQGAAPGAGGKAVGGQYSNWGPNQPDNSGGNENYASLLGNGQWNDLGVVPLTGYLVEYGGLPGETSLQLMSTTAVSIGTASPSVSTPSSPMTVKDTTLTITGSATAGSTVSVYTDANNNNMIDGADSVVGTATLSGGQTSYSVTGVTLTPNADNNFLVTAQVTGTAESNPVDVPTITQDSSPPMVTITAPAAALSTPNKTFAIAGTADAGSLVQIFRDANGNGIVDPGEANPVDKIQLPAGTTTFNRTVSLNASAANNFLVTASDAVGNESAPAAVPTITQDSTPPTVTITDPSAATTVSTSKFTITGATEAGALVKVYTDANNNNLIDGPDVQVSSLQLPAGTTLFSIPTILTMNAANNFLVTAVDLAGNLSSVTDVPTITQDSIPPTVSVTAPNAPMTISSMSVTVTGTSEVGATVKIYRDANGNGIVDAGETNPVKQQTLMGGETTFSIMVPLNLNTTNDFLVTATDTVGNESAPAKVPTITQDWLPPAGPLVTTPAAPMTTKLVTFAITGTAEANALVKVYKDTTNNNTIDAGDTFLMQMQLMGGGTAYTFNVGLDMNAANNFLVNATDAAMNVSVPADVPTITQDGIAPGAPAVTMPGAPMTVGNPMFSIVGQAEAGALVKVYKDVNNNGAIDPGDTQVSSMQLPDGTTTFTVPTMLTLNAANNFLVTATDAAGNESGPSDVPTITQDSIAPVNPTVTLPSVAATVNAPNVTITGTAEANALVRVYRDVNNNNMIDAGDMAVNSMPLSGGATTYVISVPLFPNSANNFLVTAADAAGNESGPVDVPTITADSIAPSAPGVTLPAAPTSVNADGVTIAGAAEANALIRVYRDTNNNNMIDPGELAVMSFQLTGGNSSYSLSAPLLQNTANNFLVTATDAAGNESGPTDVPTVTEDSVAPVAPTITAPIMAVSTRIATYTVTGTAEPGSLIRLYNDANNNNLIDPGEIVTSTPLGMGVTGFTLLVSLVVQNSPNNFLVTAVDAAGNESAPADVPTITQDSLPPATPTVTIPAGLVTINAATYTISGTAEANSLVRVYQDTNGNNTIDAGEKVLDTKQLVGGGTTYSFSVTLTQDAGNNFLVTAADAAGNESIPADVPTITEDSKAPVVPVVTAPPAAVTLHAPSFTVTGTVEPGALVKVYKDVNNNNVIDPEDAVVIQQQLLAGMAAFSLAATLMQNTANNFLVTATDVAGNESVPADVPTITEDSIAPGAPAVSAPTGPFTTRGTTFIVTGTAEAGTLIRVYKDANNNNQIDAGETFTIMQLPAGTTAFSVSVSLDLNAANNFLVTALDVAGNESTPADVSTITQDAIAPAAPAVTAPTAATTLNADNFSIAGTAEANALVKVYRDVNNNNVIDPEDTVFGSQLLVAGTTAYLIPVALAQDAANNFLVTATDVAGNESAPADVPTLTEDSAAPTGLTVTNPTAPTSVHAAIFTLTGTAEPNALVRVYRDTNDNNAVDTGEQVVAQVQLIGGASVFSLSVPLNQNAANTFVATATDAVKNESFPVDVPTITEDSAAPAGTTVTAPAATLTVNADTFAVTGTAEPNALVRVYQDRDNNGVIDGGDAVVGQLQLSGGGTAYSIAVPLTQDVVNNFLVTAADSLGNESAPVDVPSISEDSTPPLGPTLTAPRASVTVTNNVFTIRGTAEVNALIKVFVDANNDGVADTPATPLASFQLTGGATTFALDVGLTPNAANNFVVTATDGVGNSSSATDVPTIFADPTGPTGPDAQSFSLAGNAPLATVVGTVQATTPAGGPLTYFITDGDDAGIFALDKNTGQLTVADAAALRRSPRRVTLTVRVSNAADTPLSKNFSVTIALTDPALPKAYAAGSEGGGGVAVLYNPNGTRRLTVEAFPGATGGVRVAVGDVNGDGMPDLIAANGPGMSGVVKVYDGATGSLLYQGSPFEDKFTGGLFVEAADLNGDGRAELVVSPDVGGGPRVVVIDVVSRRVVVSFYGIEDPDFRGGCRVSLADVDADGTPDMLVAAGIGGGPRVAVFDGAALISGSITHLFNDFFVFENTLRNGVYIAGGDLNGDGYADIIAGGGPGGAPRVFAISAKDLLETGTQIVLANFFAGDPDARTAVRVTTANLDGDTRADLIAGAGSSNGDRIVVYLGKDITPDGTPPASKDFNTIDSSITFGGGVYVG
ncbi:Ig-like domain-containing protein [Limnoglobus roseus]|uniref:C-type lectin domain-containing protein n=1 Tax=Limnoglobus roseus TaxID=2598579 RepID=A0A5C1AKJ8_9BACT|nr:Ig-like domain-containing protein [Limnoglobus roseus]QEL19430.1 hypothetical protein PX52LOC_06502 [Limnoglobus roseus]